MSATPSTPGVLGIEAGGSRTTALWRPMGGPSTSPIVRTFGPANLQLTSDRDLRALLTSIAGVFPPPQAVGIGMAGARTEPDRQRVRAAVVQVWGGIPCQVTNDLEIALAAGGDAHAGTAARPTVLVLSGTGSCCYGRAPGADAVRVGGWGHLLGDQGSGYDLSLTALRQSIALWELTGRWPKLGSRLLAALHLNEPNQLIPWARGAAKQDVAALAPEVFAAARERDPLARQLLQDAARALATSAIVCARRLARGGTAAFLLAGSLLQRQPGFARQVSGWIRREFPRAIIRVLDQPGAEGAARLALAALQPPTRPPSGRIKTRPARASVVPTSDGLSPTELRHPASAELDRLPLSGAIDLFLTEEQLLAPAVATASKSIERLIRQVVRAFRAGGRLIYVGAGTSGRLGVVDASECPPTFRTPPEQVQGIIAGGAGAMFRAVEGAEDDLDAGATAIRFRDVSRRDVVVGIAASGRTPFVWGALAEARRRGAVTALIAFHPRLRFAPGQRPDVVITPDIGPELLTGSTRLKSGTATKLILNLVTTLAMVRMGKVVGNLMVDLNPSNLKLRDRARRITAELTGADAGAVEQALERSGWHVKEAVRRLGRRRPQA